MQCITKQIAIAASHNLAIGYPLKLPLYVFRIIIKGKQKKTCLSLLPYFTIAYIYNTIWFWHTEKVTAFFEVRRVGRDEF